EQMLRNLRDISPPSAIEPEFKAWIASLEDIRTTAIAYVDASNTAERRAAGGGVYRDEPVLCATRAGDTLEGALRLQDLRVGAGIFAHIREHLDVVHARLGLRFGLGCGRESCAGRRADEGRAGSHDREQPSHAQRV